MAKYSILVEQAIAAMNIDSLNKTAISTTDDIAGGNVVVLTASGKNGDNVFTATKPAAATDDVYMAYNPAEHYLVVNGNVYAGDSLTSDVRDFTNIANHPFGVFKPQKNDEIEIIDEAIAKDKTAADALVGKYLVVGDSYTLKSAAEAGTGLAFKVVNTIKHDFPPTKGTIGKTTGYGVHAICVNA